MGTPSPCISVASIVCIAVRVYAPLHLMWLLPHFIYVIAAAPLLVAVAHDMNEGLKGRVIYV